MFQGKATNCHVKFSQDDIYNADSSLPMISQLSS